MAAIHLKQTDPDTVAASPAGKLSLVGGDDNRLHITDENGGKSIVAASSTAAKIRQVVGVYFNSINANFVQCAHDASLNTTDLFCRVRIRPVAVRSGLNQLLAERWNIANNLMWQFYIGPNGNLFFLWSANGTSIVATITGPQLPLKDGQLMDLGVSFDADNGSGTREVRFWYGEPEHELQDWTCNTQLGSTGTGAASSIFNGTSVVRLGTYQLTTTGAFTGEVLACELWNGINPTTGIGSRVASARLHGQPTRWRFGTPTITDELGRTWTLSGDNWSFRTVLHDDTTYPLFVYEGDSMTTGINLTQNSTTWWSTAERRRSATNRTLFRAISSRQMLQAITDAPNTIDPFIDSADCWVFAWLGTNDLFFGANASTVQTRIANFAAARRAAGAKVVLFTILPRTEVGTPAGYETARQSINTWLRNSADMLCDLLVDIAGIPSIGDPLASNDTSFYQVDRVHLNATGYSLVANLVNERLRTVGIV